MENESGWLTISDYTLTTDVTPIQRKERLYVQQDANWNVTALINTAGNVVERFAYDPYGAVKFFTPTWTEKANTNFGWKHLHQGLRRDMAVGLDDSRARVYSADRMRWNQPDPIRFMAGDVNLYRALGNNPGNRLDPQGTEIVIGTGLVVGAGTAVVGFGLWGYYQYLTWGLLSEEELARPLPQFDPSSQAYQLTVFVDPATGQIVDPNYIKNWQKVQGYKKWGVEVVEGEYKGAACGAVLQMGSGLFIIGGKSVDLSKLGSAPGKGDLTIAGHSLTKHAAGKRAGSTAFPPAKGTPAQINQQAQKILDEILNDPAKIVKYRMGRTGEQLLQVHRADGTGVIFKWNGNDWEFSHFAENLY